MKPIEEIKGVIIDFSRNGNILSDRNIKDIREIINKIDSDNLFAIMSIACMLDTKYNITLDKDNIDKLCFYYCVKKPAECPMLVKQGIVSDMSEFFIHVKDYCIYLIKEEI